MNPEITPDEKFKKEHYDRNQSEWNSLGKKGQYALQHFGMDESEFKNELIRQQNLNPDEIFGDAPSDTELTRDFGRDPYANRYERNIEPLYGSLDL